MVTVLPVVVAVAVAVAASPQVLALLKTMQLSVPSADALPASGLSLLLAFVLLVFDTRSRAISGNGSCFCCSA